MLSVGRITTSVGGSYLWQALQRPFRSASSTEQALLAAHIRNAERVVARSKELRGAFMKLAQMLSMRSDLFPAEALSVLSVVQSSVPPMPWERVRRVLTEELGGPPETHFRHVEPEAFAAASLGQVHRATLLDGKRVVVKVQYPGVAATVHQDVQNVKALLKVFAVIARDVMRQNVDPGEVAAELEARLREELDYVHEAKNLERFRRLLADDAEVAVPRVHRALTTTRVLTMECLEGYPIQDIMAPGVDQELKDWVAVKLFGLLWRQVLEFGVLHTDPHPGNYLVTHRDRRRLHGARLPRADGRSRAARADDAHHLRAARARRALRSAELRPHGARHRGEPGGLRAPALPRAGAPGLPPAGPRGARRLPEGVRHRAQLASALPRDRRPRRPPAARARRPTRGVSAGGPLPRADGPC
jgi:predicted unusual protein kinase regulating ubiquinone biosynthesis (AarF/ABC1/UbiB family)